MSDIIFCFYYTDPFSIHFERDLAEDVAEELGDKSKWEKKETAVM